MGMLFDYHLNLHHACAVSHHALRSYSATIRRVKELCIDLMRCWILWLLKTYALSAGMPWCYDLCYDAMIYAMMYAGQIWSMPARFDPCYDVCQSDLVSDIIYAMMLWSMPWCMPVRFGLRYFWSMTMLSALLCRSHTWRLWIEFWELNLPLQAGVCFENACRNPCNFTGSGRLSDFWTIWSIQTAILYTHTKLPH